MARSGKKSKIDPNRPHSTYEDRKKYQDAWAEMMVQIWREKIMRLRVFDTSQLHNQITDNITSNSAAEMATIQHRFMEYGIYQDCGVGNGYEIDGKVYKDGRVGNNRGDLLFLDKEWRDNDYKRKQKSGKVTTGKPRQPREWFSRAYYASVMVLKEQMQYMYGEEFVGMLVSKIEEANRDRSTSMRSVLWGSRSRRRR